MLNKITDAILGGCVGDAVGVPVQFLSREEIAQKPVIGMRSFGTQNKPAGTWSDDTSLTLCLVESLSRGLNYTDIMNNFVRWIENGSFTPHGIAFDIGYITNTSINRYLRNTSPINCGGMDERDNGNGSLMRILPIVFYLQTYYGKHCTEDEAAMEIIHNVSSLTHAHERSLVGCGILISIAEEVLQNGKNLDTEIKNGIKRAFEYYEKQDRFKNELVHYERLMDKNFAKLPSEQIKSSGYVVHSLEAAIWCLLNTNNYKDCILKAVNLGEDADSIANIAGGIAGIFYGKDSIPEEWLSTIARREFVEKICEKLIERLSKKIKVD